MTFFSKFAGPSSWLDTSPLSDIFFVNIFYCLMVYLFIFLKMSFEEQKFYIVMEPSLSFLYFCYSSVITPKMLAGFLARDRTISYSGCMTQLFLEHFLTASEIIFLTVMAYDHYVGICKPLHYKIIMWQGLCQILVVVA